MTDQRLTNLQTHSKGSRSLALTLPLVVFIVIFCATLLISFTQSNLNTNARLDQYRLDLQAERRLTLNVIQQGIDELIQEILIVSGNPVINDLAGAMLAEDRTSLASNRARVNEILNTMVTVRPRLQRLTVLDTEGTIIALAEQSPTDALQDPDQESLLQQERATLRSLLANADSEVSLSPLTRYQNRFAPSQPAKAMLQISSPIFHRVSPETDNATLSTPVIAGAVIFTVDVSRIFSQSHAPGVDDVFYVLDKQGHYLHGETSEPFDTLHAEFPELAQRLADTRDELSVPQLKRPDGRALVANLSRIPVSSIYPSKQAVWLLVAKYHPAGMTPAEQFGVFLLLPLLIALLTSTLCSFIVRRQLRPLGGILHSVENYTTSSRFTPLAVDTENDFHELATAFNNLIATVESRAEELSDTKREIEETAASLDAILSTAVDGIITIDTSGKILSFNRAAEQIFGYSVHEVLNVNISRLMSDQYAAEHDDYLKQYQNTGISKIIGKNREESYGTSGRLRGKRKNGDIFPIDLSVSRVDTKAGVIFCGIVRDISDAIATQAELITAKEKAETVAKLKSEFLATMSHEIRTPMNAVQGMLGILLRSQLSNEQHRYAELAQSSAQSLLAIINDILDFSKGEAQRLTLEMIEFDLPSLVREVFDSLAFRAQELGLECILDIDPAIARHVISDPARLRQILTNLLSNAIKFTRSGEIMVKVSLVDVNGEQLQVDIAVTDTGIGIPPDRVEDLFESFTQADASTTRQYGGTGLGLAIVKQLCELLDGHITVDTTPGVGSTFCCHLPLLAASADADASTVAADDLNDLERLSVLVIDDNQRHLQLLCQQLNDAGLQATGAGNTLEAIKALQDASTPFALIIFDSSVDGHDMAQMQRLLHSTQLIDNTKLVVLTPIAETFSPSDLTASGITSTLTKPVYLPDLLASLAAVVRNEARTPKIPDAPPPLLTQLQTRANARIILVEDIAVNQELCLLMLKELGFNAVDVAANGIEAIQTLLLSPAELPFELILMDCQMPEMDGYEATRQIRAGVSGSRYRDIPIIALTANALPEDQQKCLDAGMSDYVSKPLDTERLAKALSQALNPTGPHTCSTPAKGAATSPDRSTHETSTINECAVWDQNTLLSRIDHNPDLAIQLIDLYLIQVDTDLANIKTALGASDFPAAAQTLHALRGATANLGGIKTFNLMQDLESACKQGDAATVAELHPELEQAAAELKKTMVAYRNANHTAGQGIA